VPSVLPYGEKRLKCPLQQVDDTVGHRMRFFVTHNDLLVWYVLRPNRGDIACRIKGSCVPLILRPSGDIYHIVGEAVYILPDNLLKEMRGSGLRDFLIE
jgi:hypothetical protein